MGVLWGGVWGRAVLWGGVWGRAMLWVPIGPYWFLYGSYRAPLGSVGSYGPLWGPMGSLWGPNVSLWGGVWGRALLWITVGPHWSLLVPVWPS